MPSSPCGGRVFPRRHVPWTLAAVRRHLQPLLLRRLPSCPRCNTIRRRNAQLVAIHSFFRYVLDTEPDLALLCQRALAIPVKKAPRPVRGYLSETELAHVLAQIDRSTQVGERDYFLVSLLYDTGTRIQELLNLAPCDVRFVPHPLY